MGKEDALGCDHSQKDWWPGQAQLGIPCSFKPQAEPKVGENTKILREHENHKGSTVGLQQGPPSCLHHPHPMSPPASCAPQKCYLPPTLQLGTLAGAVGSWHLLFEKVFIFPLAESKDCHKRTCPMSGAEVLHRDRCCSHGHEAAHCQDCPCRRTWGPAVQEVSGRPVDTVPMPA